MSTFESTFAENPLIAILRGLAPDRAIAVADVLVQAGYRIIEVPMNSPEPLLSIKRIAEKYGSQALVHTDLGWGLLCSNQNTIVTSCRYAHMIS